MNATTHPASRALAFVLSEQLRASGVPREVAADAAGLSRPALSRRLSGATPLSVNEVHALAPMVGLHDHELFGLAERIRDVFSVDSA